eukprot:1821590-Alexandrium_andersonii.AAC.1
MVEQLPLQHAVRQNIVAGAAATGLAWDRLCRPLRKADRNAFDAAVRTGICGTKWISAEPSLLLLMAGGHNVAILY